VQLFRKIGICIECIFAKNILFNIIAEKTILSDYRNLLQHLQNMKSVINESRKNPKDTFVLKLCY